MSRCKRARPGPGRTNAAIGWAALGIAAGLLIGTPAARAAEPAAKRWDQLGGRSALPPTYHVAIALAAADRDRVDAWIDGRDRHTERRALTGPAWAQVFRGDPANDPVLTLKSTTVTDEDARNGFGSLVTYVAEAMLTVGGQEQLIRASGRQTTTRPGIFAVRAAVEKCVLDAALQATKAAGRPAGDASQAP